MGNDSSVAAGMTISQTTPRTKLYKEYVSEVTLDSFSVYCSEALHFISTHLANFTDGSSTALVKISANHTVKNNVANDPTPKLNATTPALSLPNRPSRMFIKGYPMTWVTAP